ncbi:MAG: DHH family phosphoesterase, partial [Acidobacteriota bacterium]
MSDARRHGMRETATWLQARRRIRIASHADPDGDSLGSSLALALGLEQLGHRPEVVLGQELPASLAWLPGAGRIRVLERLPADGIAAVLIECSDFARSGIGGYADRDTLNIDHHTKNALYADVNWIDPGVAATGMMVARLLRHMGSEITPAIATLLYVTVLTDTGSFQ